MLTTAQFATQYGDNWVLADGRSVTGTLYASVTGLSTIPDMRGTFLRSKGSTYNPDGDLVLGTLTNSKFKAHTHGLGSGLYSYTPVMPIIVGDSSNMEPLTLVQTQPTGGNETAPVSITVNIFIRIN
jgi:exosome complex RNA-binding protein Rrp4